MPIKNWSEGIVLADLGDEPALSEEMDILIGRLEDHEGELPDVVLNLGNVTYFNSTNISQLLKLRKRLADGDGRLRLTAVGDGVWSVMLVTGLDKVFTFNEDVMTALASLQLEEEEAGAPGGEDQGDA